MFTGQISQACGCDASAHLAGLLPVEKAVELALEQVAPLAGTECLAIHDAIGRTTAGDIAGTRQMPPFDNSAMDGFALRARDANTRRLPVAGTIAAGDVATILPQGHAIRIFTGAPVPHGADTVIMVEDCTDEGSHVCLTRQPALNQNIRRAGDDQSKGQVLVNGGTRLAPRHIGLLAANGITEIEVIRKPRVGVFSTGDELHSNTGNTCDQFQIHDANRPLLLALIRSSGADAHDLGILPDDAAATRDAIAGLGDRFDLIVSSGAVSMGGKDHVRSAFEAAGGQISAWRVALKPGKPVVLGQLDRAAFTGLPGNPLAAYVGFHLFVAPQIARLNGRTPAAFAATPASAGFNWTRTPGRAEIFPVRLLGHDVEGLPLLQRLGKGRSSSLLALSDADGLAIIPCDTDRVTAGDPLLWNPFHNEVEL